MMISPEYTREYSQSMQEVIDSLGGLDHARRIAEALPRTADGVVVINDDIVYSRKDPEKPRTIRLAIIDSIGEDDTLKPDEFADPCAYPRLIAWAYADDIFGKFAADCYSTRDAAYAAAKQSGGE